MTKTEVKELEVINEIYKSVAVFIEIVGQSKYALSEELRMEADRKAFYIRGWLESEGVSTALLDAIENEWVA